MSTISLSHFQTGGPTADDEEGGHPDAEPQADGQIEEAKIHARVQLLLRRSHEPAGPQQVLPGGVPDDDG